MPDNSSIMISPSIPACRLDTAGRDNKAFLPTKGRRYWRPRHFAQSARVAVRRDCLSERVRLLVDFSERRVRKICSLGDSLNLWKFRNEMYETVAHVLVSVQEPGGNGQGSQYGGCIPVIANGSDTLLSTIGFARPRGQGNKHSRSLSILAPPGCRVRFNP